MSDASGDPKAGTETDLAPEDMTIEELARQTGLAFTTIRMYQHKGLLPPPERRGRVGYYGWAHLARLELIAQLQERGYSLAAIRDLVDTWQEGRSLAQVLGLEASAAKAVAQPAELRLRPEELVARFDGVELPPEAMQRAYHLGLVAFDGDTVIVPDPMFLEVGSALARLGVSLDDILDEYEHLEGVAADLAGRFTGVFERNLWQPFVARGMPADELEGLTEALSTLGPLAEQIVLAAVRRALTAQAQQFLADQAKAL